MPADAATSATASVTPVPNHAGLLVDEADVRTFLAAEYGGEGAQARFAFVSGGVSSSIVRVELEGGCFILKQALPQLRVSSEWRSRPERSSVEVRCARTLERLVPGAVPRVLREFPRHHAFSMACAPAGSQPWKTVLLAGAVTPRDAGNAGGLLGDIHARSAAEPELAARFADTSFFEELRLDPYLRVSAERHPDLAPVLLGLAEALLRPGACLVHADFSPKNLLVTPAGEMLVIDHEVAHWGHPAFDLAFLLNHLCLKGLRFDHARTDYLRAADDVLAAYGRHAGPTLQRMAAGPVGGRLLGGLMLARVDGKSPVEYLDDEGHRALVRQVARRILAADVADLEAALDIVKAARR